MTIDDSFRLSYAARGSVAAIRLYQRALSPMLGAACRFEPSCSRYALQAIERFGFWHGWALGLYRILRCNPFAAGGADPVPTVATERRP
jgi:uncharacterized protein